MLKCELCGDPANAGDTLLCSSCRADLPWIETACYACGLPLAANGLCGRCAERAPPFVRTLAVGRYAFPLDTIIMRLKFAGALHLAKTCGALIVGALSRTGAADVDCVLPMPLHPHRLRTRGYNQAAEIARHVGAALNIPVATHWCRRVRNTAPQTQLPRSARHANVHGAFVLEGTANVRRVAIVDDVITTGATAAELAGVLQRAGVRHIELWAPARAVLYG